MADALRSFEDDGLLLWVGERDGERVAEGSVDEDRLFVAEDSLDIVPLDSVGDLDSDGSGDSDKVEVLEEEREAVSDMESLLDWVFLSSETVMVGDTME